MQTLGTGTLQEVAIAPEVRSVRAAGGAAGSTTATGGVGADGSQTLDDGRSTTGGVGEAGVPSALSTTSGVSRLMGSFASDAWLGGAVEQLVVDHDAPCAAMGRRPTPTTLSRVEAS